MALSPEEMINGFLSLVFLTTSLIIGLKILSKYFKHKKKELLFAALAVILLSSIYWDYSISFIAFLTLGIRFPDQVYFIIGIPYLPWALFCFIYTLSELMFKKQQKIVLSLFLAQTIIFEVIFFTMLIIQPSLIGRTISIVDSEYEWFILSYIIFLNVILILTAILFAKNSMGFDDPTVKLKGQLILLGVLLFSAGGFLDVFSSVSIAVLIVGRIIITISGVILYIGIASPKRIVNFLLKGKIQ